MWIVLAHFSIAFATFFKPISSCRVEECALWFRKTKEYENLQPRATEQYCQVLHTYLKCMNDTMKFCHGNLGFHSSELVMRRHWKEFECSKWASCSDDKEERKIVNTCYFNPLPNHRKLKYCSLFGDPHLLMFNGSTQTCSEAGARPLVDNRYFLVQVTNRNIRGEGLTTTVSKITVIVRKHNCTESLRYEANADEQGLSQGFVDGTTFQKKDLGSRNSVEILWQNDNYVEIALHFIHSSIHIRRQGPYLSVSVKGPAIVMESDSDVANEMCWAGCRKSDVIEEEKLFKEPRKFVQCYGRRLHVPKKIAEERCTSVGLTDTFFDACVFDLMLTGDDYLVHLSRMAQSDFGRLAPKHMQSMILKSRISHNHHHNAHLNQSVEFQNCVPSGAQAPPLLLIFLAIFLNFFCIF